MECNNHVVACIDMVNALQKFLVEAEAETYPGVDESLCSHQPGDLTKLEKCGII